MQKRVVYLIKSKRDTTFFYSSYTLNRFPFFFSLPFSSFIFIYFFFVIKQISGDHTDSLLENLTEDVLLTTTSDDEKKIKTNGIDDDKLKLKRKNVKEIITSDNKANRLYKINEVPLYLRHNVYILTGYRGMLNTKLCMER